MTTKKVILADSQVCVEGWEPCMDHIGAYTLRTHKSPDEIASEKAAAAAKCGTKRPKIVPYKYEQKSMFSIRGDKCYMLPGNWPRVKEWLDRNGRVYETVDRRNPEIRPQLDVSKLEGVEFRQGQAELLALIECSDCGIIDCTVGFGKSFCMGLICRALTSPIKE